MRLLINDKENLKGVKGLEVGKTVEATRPWVLRGCNGPLVLNDLDEKEPETRYRHQQ